MGIQSGLRFDRPWIRGAQGLAMKHAPGSPVRSKVPWWGKLALIVGSSVFVLGILEIALRLPGPWAEIPKSAPQPLDPELRDLPVMTSIWALSKKNQYGVFKGTLYRTNSSGFRGREYAVPKPPGVFRIVAIGDSFTMGSGVREQDTYSQRLERLLDTEDPSRVVEVLNLGIAGFNLRASIGRLKRIGLRFQPDLVVYGWTTNDIEGPFYRKSFEKETRSQSRSHLVRWLSPRWRELRHYVSPEKGSYLWELDDNYFRNPAAWEYFLADLDEFASILRKQKVCGVVMLHTELQSLTPLSGFQRYYNAVQAVTEEREFFVIPTFSKFPRDNPRSLWVGPNDPHPNARGHEILANALRDGLRRLPEHCWGRPSSAR
jgi:lysophospholipase L1-like esterase